MSSDLSGSGAARRRGYRIATTVVLLLPWAAALPALAKSPPVPSDPASLQAATWAASCMACHGAEGRSTTGVTSIPSIGGRPAPELLKRLQAYKNGEEKATVMHQHARGYSDEELARIADQLARY